jgi:hypothetical protein
MSNKVKFEIHELKDFSNLEKEKFHKAMSKCEVILNSEKFKNELLNLKLEQTEGKTNLQIYDEIMLGADKLNKEADQDVDVYLTIYYSFKSTVGYTYPSTWRTWINRKFFSKFDEGEIAGNVMHEYMHKLGYGHRTAKDHNSVPYAVGYLVRDLIKKIDTPEVTTITPEEILDTSGKKYVCYRSWKNLWLTKTCRWE